MITVIPGTTYLFETKGESAPDQELRILSNGLPGADPAEVVMALIDNEKVRQEDPNEQNSYANDVLRALENALSAMMRRREWENREAPTFEDGEIPPVGEAIAQEA